LVVTASSTVASTPSTSPNTSALRGSTTCRASGRRSVRCITLSMSRSYQQFSALALPAASVPPARVATISQNDGRPRWASTMVGTVVTRSSSMMRGLVNAT
jgi:hypothetical protein